jgi:phenylacetate-CoA ligase
VYTKVKKSLRGVAGAYIAYPLAERLEKRDITTKVNELKRYYQLPFAQRKVMMLEKLVKTLSFAKTAVPYYRDVFHSIQFDPERLYSDIAYLQELPYLTKDIIREQGERLLAAPLDSVRHHIRKTGGSTGVSAVIYYDQVGLDYSAAVTRYARENIGHTAVKSELHFAASFAKPPKTSLPSKDDIKNFALNRNNIFFDRLDDQGLGEILSELTHHRVHLVHGHPSTLYALACYVEANIGSVKVFDIFESSGELLQDYMRKKIKQAFNCTIVDRYGSAEFGIIGYEFDGEDSPMQLLDSEGWGENIATDEGDELVFTGFHNRLMPLIRYKTGDMATIEETDRGQFVSSLTGRIHDIVEIGGVKYPTHNIMDVMDHRIGGIQEFQISLEQGQKPKFSVVLEQSTSADEVRSKLLNYWQNNVDVVFVENKDLVRVGRNAKFRHVVL